MYGPLPAPAPAAEWEKEALDVATAIAAGIGYELPDDRLIFTRAALANALTRPLAAAFARIAAAARADGAGEMRERAAKACEARVEEQWTDPVSVGCNAGLEAGAKAIRSLPLPQEPSHD